MYFVCNHKWIVQGWSLSITIVSEDSPNLQNGALMSLTKAGICSFHTPEVSELFESHAIEDAINCQLADMQCSLISWYAALWSWQSCGKFATRFWFLQHISIACYAERCTSYSKSIHPSVTRRHRVGMTHDTNTGSSLEDCPMTPFLVVNFSTKFQREHREWGCRMREDQRGRKK